MRQSPSTPHFSHKTAYAYGAELAFIKEFSAKTGSTLPQPFFWRLKPYKHRYSALCIIVQRCMKIIGEFPVLQALTNDYFKFISYGILMNVAKKYVVNDKGHQTFINEDATVDIDKTKLIDVCKKKKFMQ